MYFFRHIIFYTFWYHPKFMKKRFFYLILSYTNLHITFEHPKMCIIHVIDGRPAPLGPREVKRRFKQKELAVRFNKLSLRI